MKVNNNKPLDIQDIISKGNVNSKQAVREHPKEKMHGPDKVDISEKAKELAALKEEAIKVAEIREKKVQAISDDIKAGRYKINPQKIAGKMIDEII